MPPDDEADLIDLMTDIEDAVEFADYLGGVAADLAQAQSSMLASIVPKISFADSMLAKAWPGTAFAGIAARAAGLDTFARLAVPPGLGLFQASSPSSFLAAGFPADAGCTAPVLDALARLAVPPDLGFTRRIADMTGSWDLGLLNAGRLAESTAAALAVPHQEWLRSIAGLTASGYSAIGSFSSLSGTAGLVGLLRSWRAAAETSLGVLGTFARAAYWAALLARRAVLTGETELVASFIEEWLGMQSTPERVEAVSTALLEEGWDAGAAVDQDLLLADLRRRAKRQARALKPIWETRLNRRYVGSLDQPAAAGSSTLMTIADQLPDPATAEDLALAREHEQQRLRQVLDWLKPDEREVTSMYAEYRELTWTEAAHLAGAADPAAMGERVRRKLKRLGAEHGRRLARAGRP
jgi:DNA-directed RNA polymerase specialized sigma24 family protein